MFVVMHEHVHAHTQHCTQKCITNVSLCGMSRPGSRSSGGPCRGKRTANAWLLSERRLSTFICIHTHQPTYPYLSHQWKKVVRKRKQYPCPAGLVEACKEVDATGHVLRSVLLHRFATLQACTNAMITSVFIYDCVYKQLT